LNTGSIRLYLPKGLLTTVLQIPNAINTSDAGLAVDTDGSFAIATGLVMGADGKFLLLSKSESRQDHTSMVRAAFFDI